MGLSQIHDQASVPFKVEDSYLLLGMCVCDKLMMGMSWRGVCILSFVFFANSEVLSYLPGCGVD